MDTNVRLESIEVALARYFGGWRAVLCATNISWGFFAYHEADFLCISRSGYLTEVEIKRSWQDFLNDFKKRRYTGGETLPYEAALEYWRQDWEMINRLFYAVPEKIAQRCAEHIESLPPETGTYITGILCYDEPQDGSIPAVRMFKRYSQRRKDRRPLTMEEQYKIARLQTLRFWTMQERTCVI